MIGHKVELPDGHKDFKHVLGKKGMQEWKITII